MEEQSEVGTFVNYEEYKAAFDAEVQRTELGFVRIGFMLRVAQDTAILRESGYENMEEFAWKEYRLDKSQTSRFIRINRRFSLDGYSDELREPFRGYGVAKLGEMLSLSDQVIEALPPQLTRTEIQEVKREIKEEQSITDLEVMLEGDPPRGEKQIDGWMKVYCREHAEAFLKIQALHRSKNEPEEAMGLLAPSGQAALMARIPGSGKLMLVVRGKEMPLELINVRSNEKEEYSWEDCIRALKSTCPESDRPKEAYEAIYSIPFPEKIEKEEVAPVQPNQPVQPIPRAKPDQSVKPIQPAEKLKAPSGREIQQAQPERLEIQKEASREPKEPQTLGTEQMEIKSYPGIVPEADNARREEDAEKPKESIRDEGARLAEDVAQWMKTGTMDYIQEVDQQIRRLLEIVKEIMDEKHS